MGSFSDLLGAMTPRTFAREHWERATTVFRGTATDWARSFSREDFERATQRSEARARVESDLEFHVRAMFDHSSDSDPDPWMGVHAVSSAEIGPTLERGGSICVHNICAGDAALARLTVSAKQALHYAGDVGMSGYMSGPTHGLRPHFDAQAVLAIQVAGRKRWDVEATPCTAAPASNATLSADDCAAWTDDDLDAPAPPPPRSMKSIVLEPGDAVFVPPGTWHATQALDLSMGLVLYFRPITFAAMLEPMVWEMFADDPSWRRGTPALARPSTPLASMPPEIERYLGERLDQLATRVGDRGRTTSVASRVWHRLVARLGPHNRGPVTSGTDPVEPSSRLALDQTTTHSLATDDSDAERVVRLFVDDAELALPAAAEPIIEGIVNAGCFVAAEAQGWGHSARTWSDVRPLLQALVDCRFLAIMGRPVGRRHAPARSATVSV